ncbi:hypothetical protein Syun_000958 [Stephania yunnanensis]|uniref:Uncharacterized protein n=1 Tax=Stephania yunnanensis TaxID=152371 RepID=A0AAP0Q6N3_9MAGN
MAMTVMPHRESSSGSINKHLDSGKYVRYTAEQVEALERVYSECPKPSSMRRQQLIRECPILSNIEPKQIKVWCREKQRKESCRLQTVNRKLTAMNKLLMEENDRLQKQVSQLVYENGYMRQQLQNCSNYFKSAESTEEVFLLIRPSLPCGSRLQFNCDIIEWATILHPFDFKPKNFASVTADASCESVVTTPQHSLRDANNPAGLLSIAEETLAEFLSKATGTAVDWVQMPGMKPGPDSVGIVAISHSCSGVAARACGLVSLEPTKIADILKDRPSWFRECRNLEVFSMLPAGNGGTIELIYMQMFAPTTLAPARDFWTLRYTTTLEDGSLVVCERSLSGSGSGPNASAASQFVRAQMLPSGYLIRPCEGGGSIIHIVDHLNLEAWSVPEVLRPLYQSSKVVAQKMTVAALRHIRQIAQETSGEVVYSLGRQPAVLRTFSQRLSRRFNDAVNGFNDDGWSLLNCDGAEDVIVAVNSKSIGTSGNPAIALQLPGGVLCVKASMLLQNVPPALLVRFLREHRSEWADYNIDAYSAATVKAGSYSFPGSRPTRFSGSQIIMPLGHTVEHEELLEVIRLEGHAFTQEEAVLSRDIHLLQICSGVDENAVGACSELVFAPIDEMFPDDVPLLPSGFRIIPLDSKTDTLSSHRTLDLASSLEVGQTTTRTAGEASPNASNTRSVLTIAFQFPFEHHLQDTVAAMARQYVRSVIASVQRVAMAIAPSGLGPYTGSKLSPGSPEAVTLAQWICQKLLRCDGEDGDSVLKLLWHHPDAILCCSLKSLPVFTFANQAGLDMLETTLVTLQDITLDKIFDESGRKSLCTDFAKIMQQGFAYLPAGICISTMGRHISFEQAIAWKVMTEDNTVHCLAFTFVNWSFV